MRIIGVDPGPKESAYCVLVDGAVKAFAKVSNKDIFALLKVFPSNDILVIEQVASYGMAVGEDVFETVFWSGRFAQEWDGEFHRIKRLEVKMHLCHDSRAKDCNIRQALIDRYGPQGTKKSPGPTYGISGDCWSALAVATTFFDKANEPKSKSHS